MRVAFIFLFAAIAALASAGTVCSNSGGGYNDCMNGGGFSNGGGYDGSQGQNGSPGTNSGYDGTGGLGGNGGNTQTSNMGLNQVTANKATNNQNGRDNTAYMNTGGDSTQSANSNQENNNGGGGSGCMSGYC